MRLQHLCSVAVILWLSGGLPAGAGTADRAAEITIAGRSSAEWRNALVDELHAGRPAITDAAVLAAMRAVPRHQFVPAQWRDQAYHNRPLPIGEEQTISQPFIVAYMTQLARVKPGDTVLEVGTGSGYQAAVLAEMGAEVYTIEIIESLGRQAEAVLRELQYDRVHVRVGDGYRGWPEHAPFQAIVVTAAPEHVPQPLVDQLALGGRMVIPVGPQSWAGQSLQLITKTARGITVEDQLDVRFVPMTGEAEQAR